MKSTLFPILTFAVILTGCATVQDQSLLSQLQLRVGDIERQMDMKDEQIKELKYEIKDLAYAVERFKSQVPPKASAPSKIPAVSQKMETTMEPPALTAAEKKVIRVATNVRQVQTALQKAGYYDGIVDGKLGKGTRRAISAFQKDRGLKGDGVIGDRTWTELKSYLE